MHRIWIAAAVAAAGCSQVLGIGDLSGPGGDDGPIDAAIDAAPDAQIGNEVRITGVATLVSGPGLPQAPASGAQVDFVLASTGLGIVNAQCNQSGAFSLTVATEGRAVDGWLVLNHPQSARTAVFFPRPLTANPGNLDVAMLSFQAINDYGSLCSGTATPNTVTIFATVLDSSGSPVAGAQPSTQPDAQTFCFGGLQTIPQPSGKTGDDGVVWAYGINAGQAMIVTPNLSGHPERMLPALSPGSIAFVPLAP